MTHSTTTRVHPSAAALESLLKSKGYVLGWPFTLPDRARQADLDLAAAYDCPACGYVGAMQARPWHRPFTRRYVLALCCLSCGCGVEA